MSFRREAWRSFSAKEPFSIFIHVAGRTREVRGQADSDNGKFRYATTSKSGLGNQRSVPKALGSTVLFLCQCSAAQCSIPWYKQSLRFLRLRLLLQLLLEKLERATKNRWMPSSES